MSDAYIYDAVRTPRGKGNQAGSLHSVKPISLVTGLMLELQDRHQLDTALIDDVLLGCVTPLGDQGANLARIAALAAGWDARVAGMQLNRFCASGLEAVNLAAQKIRSDWQELVLAGGVESVSRVAPGADRGPWGDDPATSLRTNYVPVTTAADLLATLDGLRREQLDACALRSHQRAAAARTAGRFRALVPVRDQNGVLILDQDELIAPAATMDALDNLPAMLDSPGAAGYDRCALRKYPQLPQLQHLHTAGNSAAGADGAALALVGSKGAGARLGLEPRARIAAAAVTGGDPTLMLAGAAPAARKALAKAGLSVNDIDLFEVHESHAAVVLHFMRELDVAADQLNVNGGAIALGDPHGASGCMQLATLLDELEARRQRYGLLAIGARSGMGVATVIERI